MTNLQTPVPERATRNRIAWCVLLALFLSCPGPAPRTAAQDAVSPRPPFRLETDLSRFAGSDSLTLAELAYGISEAALTYRRDSAGFNGSVGMSLEVRVGDRLVDSREWTISRTIPESLAGNSARNILSLEKIALPEGEYVVVLGCRDLVDSSRRDSAVIPVTAAVWSPGVAGLSDIELSSGISSPGEGGGLFTKNTLEVIPNPARVYGGGLSVLHFYTEVYNLKSSGTGDVVVRAVILDPGGREVAARAKEKKRLNNSSVEYGSMNVASLPGGTYTFRLTLVDSLSRPPRVLASAEKKFFLFDPDGAAGAPIRPASGAGDAFAGMTAGALDDEIRKIMYIAAEPEKQQAGELADSVAKRNFLRAFWSGRDTDGATVVNEARERYLESVARANQKYREYNREGWLTDRGRVFILYGPPDDVERHPNESECHPYEIWKYNALRGGVHFVFVDLLGFGGYRLVHSTHPDELRNDAWFETDAKIR